MQPESSKKILVILTNEDTLSPRERRESKEERNSRWQQEPQEERWARWLKEGKELPEGKKPMGTEVSRRTGVDIKEVAYIWDTLHRKKQLELVFASPDGGETPIDPLSMKEAEKDSTVRELLRDKSLMDTFRNTKKLSDLTKHHESFAWVIVPGCHGAMIDLPESRSVQDMIACVYERNGFVAAIGHGTAALLHIKDKKTNDYLVKNKRITCFSDREEEEMGFKNLIPFSIEQKLRQLNARIENEKPFEKHVVVDGHLVTAQNSYSAHLFVQKIVETCEREHRRD